MKIIKQMICKHDYEKTGDRYMTKNKHYFVPVGVYKCRKCGKVAYK